MSVSNATGPPRGPHATRPLGTTDLRVNWDPSLERSEFAEVERVEQAAWVCR